MAMNTSKRAIIEQRRELVARLRLKGFSQREIVEMLPKLKCMNVVKGKDVPWSLGLINSDIQTIENRWKEATLKTVDEYKLKQLLELDEVKRLAWIKSDLSVVLKALDQEANILGTKASIKQELSGGLKVSHEQALEQLK